MSPCSRANVNLKDVRPAATAAAIRQMRSKAHSLPIVQLHAPQSKDERVGTVGSSRVAGSNRMVTWDGSVGGPVCHQAIEEVSYRVSLPGGRPDCLVSVHGSKSQNCTPVKSSATIKHRAGAQSASALLLAACCEDDEEDFGVWKDEHGAAHTQGRPHKGAAAGGSALYSPFQQSPVQQRKRQGAVPAIG